MNMYSMKISKQISEIAMDSNINTKT